MNTKYINIEKIGTVKLTRRKNSKRISLRVKPDGTITVNYPWYESEKTVLEFVIKNSEWIAEQKNKISAQKIKFELNQVIKTQMQTIRIKAVQEGVLKSNIDHNGATISVPDSESIHSDRVQCFIIETITSIFRREAQIYLPFRVEELAKANNFNYERVFIKNQKSRWGSCSSLGNINLNLQLVGLPEHLIDYIILHELSHTVEMNHGPKFCALLNKVCNGKANEFEEEMKSYSLIH